MSLTIRAPTSPANYDHEVIYNPNPVSVCGIRQEPYRTGDQNQPASMANYGRCQAICLTSCRHIVGRECFALWIKKHIDTCSFFNHHVPQVPKPITDLGDLIDRVFDYLCSTRVFAFLEDLTLQMHLAIVKPMLVNALAAMHE